MFYIPSMLLFTDFFFQHFFNDIGKFLFLICCDNRLKGNLQVIVTNHSNTVHKAMPTKKGSVGVIPHKTLVGISPTSGKLADDELAHRL